jgi:DUF971 family protein
MTRKNPMASQEPAPFHIPIRPKEIHPSGDRAMAIIWEDGNEQVVTFLQLRKACPCASCRELMETAEKVTPIDDRYQLRILPKDAPSDDPLLVRLDWVGNYAVRLVWNDGHDTGIYKFEYLRELGEENKKDGE